MFTPSAVAKMMMESRKLKEVETDQEMGEDVDEKETIKKSHPELFPPQETKEFPCHICHLVFNRKFNRDKHIELIHRIPRPERPPLYPTLVEYQKKPCHSTQRLTTCNTHK